MSKPSQSRRPPWSLGSALLMAVATGCGAGFFASQPWIRDADNNDVVFLGDSIFALSGDIQSDLYTEAGETFRNYTTSGAEITGGILAPSVASQFETAFDDDDSSTIVVMDGGGNDILIPVVALFDPYGCQTHWWRRSMSSRCKAFIDDLYVDVVDLLDDMDDAGVEEVIYQGYYATTSGTLGADGLGQAVSYGDGVLSDACADSSVSCVFIDPRSTVKSSDIISDGVHPNASGSAKLADLVWDELEPLL